MRELINQGGASFGVKGISREKKTGEIISQAYVREGDEQIIDLADQLIERLKSKAAKHYSPGTVLVIECVPNGIVFEPEWDSAIERVKDARIEHSFREVFMFCGYLHHATTLWGTTKSA